MRRILSVLVALLVAAVAAPGSAWGADRLVTAVQDPLDTAWHEPDPGSAYRVARGAGARVVRVPVPWSTLASTRPATPTDPDDPAYNWSWLDQRVRRIHGAGLEPLLVLHAAPLWARIRGAGGRRTEAPHAGDFAAFAAAAARRYDGTRSGLARVRYWQIWNEPNHAVYFSVRRGPQRYRAMLNAAYRAIHAVVRSNTVVAGGLSPFGGGGNAWAPLRFMRELLCVSRGPRSRATCRARTHFDAWSHHPYTSGGPTHDATARDDVSIGDLSEMRGLLRSARRANHIVSRGPPAFWVTEFSWESKPDDPWGVPLNVHARWVAEGLYRMWSDGVSLVTWFALRDGPQSTEPFGFGVDGGLYFRTTESYADERVKPAAQAFRFPFVAVPERGRVTIWGRTPDSRRHVVTIERRRGRGWARLGRIRTNRHGIFRSRRKRLAGAVLRARVGETASLPFRAVKTPDLAVRPFGDGPA